MRTPWGYVQGSDELADGILQVTTASHGGIVLSKERAAQLPEPFKGKRYWEEDIEWSIPYWFFREAIREECDDDYHMRTLSMANDIINRHYNEYTELLQSYPAGWLSVTA